MILPNKRGPTLKPNSSKVGTCQGQNVFTLLINLHFKSSVFKCVWPPHERGFQLTKVCLLCISYAKVIRVQSFICRSSKIVKGMTHSCQSIQSVGKGEGMAQAAIGPLVHSTTRGRLGFLIGSRGSSENVPNGV